MLCFSVAVRSLTAMGEEELMGLKQAASLSSRHLYEEAEDTAFVFIEAVMDDRLQCIAMLSSDMLKKQAVDEHIRTFLRLLAIQPDTMEAEEITCCAAARKLRAAAKSGYVHDGDAVIDELGIRWLGRGSMTEKLITADMSKEAVLQQAGMFLDLPCFIAEVERIYQKSSAVPYSGHPVHYVIEMDCQDMHLQLTDLLLGALYANKRVRSRRYVVKKYASVEPINETRLQDLYEACEGGTCVIDYVSGDRGHEDPGPPDEDDLDMICGVIGRYKHSVLTAVCITPAQKEMGENIMERLPALTFVKIAREGYGREGAAAYLMSLAGEAGALPDESLRNGLAADRHSFTLPELREHFDKWYGDHLTRHVYPQYAALAQKSEALPDQQLVTQLSAYAQLQRMVGLQDAKSVMEQLLNYRKAREMFGNKGAVMDRLPMHMVFTGNPGTAKTSVARLFARIMKDEGLLPVGDLLEVGRADLVGKYVGWTARLVRDKFREAGGSVLFIDEAYALADGREGMYGDEAINTIVQEMENQRDSVAVIFAGYPGKMENFLKKNPGLRSRIGFRVHFPDYSAPELYEILASIADNSHMALAPDLRGILLPLFEMARKEEDFGNGRFVRNLFDKARLRQASRLLLRGNVVLSKMDVMTLCADDFDMSGCMMSAQPRCLIGFGSSQFGIGMV